MDTFNFELVSPDRKLMSESAFQVTIPGEDGTFGVRAGHMSLVASIRPGVIEVVPEKGAPTQKIFISGGFADVTATNCTVLAEEAIKVADLDMPAIESEIKSLSEDMASGRDPIETARIQRRLDLAKAKLAAATDKRAA
ncbi:MAG: ATP synthase F1 subunit epsilon [Alphaproteobacteria bacterium]|nr:ATP synthase F1 subunit epsilon [Alphaproteobacteria bacterium]